MILRLPFKLFLLPILWLALAILLDITNTGLDGDFIEYWAAFRVFITGGNPYNPDEILLFQNIILSDLKIPLMMWNPPWLLMIMSPVLSFNFYFSKCLWMSFNVVMQCYCCWYLINTIFSYTKDKLEINKKKISILILVSFAPFYFNILNNQLGCLLLIGALSLFKFLRSNSIKDLLIAAVLLSIKPHSFLIFGICVLVQFIKDNKFKEIFAVLFSIIGIIISAEAINYGVTINWANSIINPVQSDILIPSANWITPTLVGKLGLISSVNGSFSKSIIFVVPFIGLITCLIFNYKNGKDILKDENTFSTSLLISTVFTPFGWVFDYTVLCIPIVSLLKNHSKHILSYISVVIFQLYSLFYLLLFTKSHNELWWFSGVNMMLILGLCKIGKE